MMDNKPQPVFNFDPKREERIKREIERQEDATWLWDGASGNITALAHDQTIAENCMNDAGQFMAHAGGYQGDVAYLLDQLREAREEIKRLDEGITKAHHELEVLPAYGELDKKDHDRIGFAYDLLNALVDHAKYRNKKPSKA